jgi:hypothetical protein
MNWLASIVVEMYFLERGNKLRFCAGSGCAGCLAKAVLHTAPTSRVRFERSVERYIVRKGSSQATTRTALAHRPTGNYTHRKGNLDGWPQT